MKTTTNLPVYYLQKNEQKRNHFGVFLAVFALLLLFTNFAFTFKAMSDVQRLREEIEALKQSLTKLEFYGSSRNVDQYDDLYTDYETNLTGSNDQTDNYYEYPELSEDNEVIALKADSLFTKDLKTRNKRNIVGYADDGMQINAESFDDERKRNLTQKKIYSHSLDASTPRPIYTRKSRVLSQDDLPKAFRQVGNQKTSARRSADSTQSGENFDVEFTMARDVHQNDGHPRHTRMGRMRPLPTAHFSGDTSRYVLGQHENFNGNGHLRHPQRTFIDWRESNWFHNLGMDRHFEFHDGILTIKENGLYFVYAQIFYLDEHDTNGFRVYRNEETLLQCTTMTHSQHKVIKGNTCYTAAADYLQEGDLISLADLSDSRYSLFEPGKSFFGVIKLGDVKAK